MWAVSKSCLRVTSAVDKRVITYGGALRVVFHVLQKIANTVADGNIRVYTGTRYVWMMKMTLYCRLK